MKKIFLIVLVSLLVSTAFAVETKYDSFGFHFSVPLIFENEEESGVKADTNMTSIGFGIHALSLYTDKVGLYVNMDLIFPQKMNIKITYSGQSYSATLDRDDYDSLWGLSALFAPAFAIAKTDKMLFTIAPGIHYVMLFAEANNNPVVAYLFGLGVNVQDSIFFSSNGYFTIGADIAYDFLGLTITNGESESGTTHDFILNPRIGIGFRFE